MSERHLHRISVVIPVFNEAANLPALFDRVTAVLKAMPFETELIFVDDGSLDESVDVLRKLQVEGVLVKVVELLRNFGQHAAVMAGMSQSEGDAVVTLDADLQNPPEEIPKLVRKIEEGYDVVAGRRKDRKDSFSRKLASRSINRVMAKATGVELHDYGCMLRAYHRQVVDAMVGCRERHTFVPALANSVAKRIVEIDVEHAERQEGESKYSLGKLLRLNFDLVTGFTTVPLQAVSFAGMLIALAGVAFGAFLFLRRLIVGPEVEGVFTLFAILFIFIGVQIFAVGLVGEYLSRIYDEVRGRPRFLIREITIEGEERK